MLIYYYIQNSNCSDKENIYYVLFTNKWEDAKRNRTSISEYGSLYIVFQILVMCLD